MEMRASFTVKRVVLTPEQMASWRASMDVLMELLEASVHQQQSIPVEIPIKGEIYVEG